MKRSFDSTDPQYTQYKNKVVLVDSSPNNPNQESRIQVVSSRQSFRSSPQDLVKLAKEIQTADTNIHSNASNKLQIIAQQVRFLQKQAKDVLMEAKRNKELHHVACNFVKIPGNNYHLYRRVSGQEYFSLLSPEEWGTCPNEYLGSYRLEQDNSWTPTSQIVQKDEESAVINKILSITDKNRLTLHGLSMEVE